MLDIHSEPQRFALHFTPGCSESTVNCTFAIPAGIWIQGRWIAVGDRAAGPAFTSKRVSGDLLTASGDEGAAYTASSGVSDAMLKAINAAAGGILTVEMTDTFAERALAGASDTVLAFALVLEGNAWAMPSGPGNVVTFTYDMQNGGRLVGRGGPDTQARPA